MDPDKIAAIQWDNMRKIFDWEGSEDDFLRALDSKVKELRHEGTSARGADPPAPGQEQEQS